MPLFVLFTPLRSRTYKMGFYLRGLCVPEQRGLCVPERNLREG